MESSAESTSEIGGSKPKRSATSLSSKRSASSPPSRRDSPAQSVHASSEEQEPQKYQGRRYRRRESHSGDAAEIIEKIETPTKSKHRKRVEDSSAEAKSSLQASNFPRFDTATREKQPQSPPAGLSRSDEPRKVPDIEVSVYSLSTTALGKYEMPRTATLAELRRRIESLADSNERPKPSFAFYDLQAKQKILNESQQKISKLPAVVVVDRESSLSSILAQSTIMGEKAVRAGKNTMSFQVVWYEPIYKTFHPVVLHFADTRISVHASGGAFNLFDLRTLRVPLVIRPVIGSKKAFQFAQHEDGTRVSQFFCPRNSLRQAIFVYFSFVWRPRAVRRGYMPPMKTEASFVPISSENDPKSFIEQLKTHSREISSILQEIESSNDPKVVRSYLKVFFHMFSGVEAPSGSSLASPLAIPVQRENESSSSSRPKASQTKIRELQLKLQAIQRRSDAVEESNGKDGDFPEKDTTNLPPSVPPEKFTIPGDELFNNASDSLYLDEQALDLESSNRISLQDLARSIDQETGEGPPIPPPPPPLPPPSIKSQPPILAINFDSIPVARAPGTVWEEISALSIPEQAKASLKEDLKRTFGSSAKKKAVGGRDVAAESFENSFSILEPSRLRNLEVLLHMTEFKEFGTDVDNFIVALQTMDPRLFNLSVLERLVRAVGTGDNRSHAFLPSRIEITQLEAFEKYCHSRGVDPLRLLEGRVGELFFYRLFKEIPDREERITFAYFMEKFRVDKFSILQDTKLVLSAVEAVLGSVSFKKVLRIVFEILNILNPKQGLSRGFRISTLMSKIDRVSGLLEVSSSSVTEAKKPTRPPKGIRGTKNDTLGKRLKSIVGETNPDHDMEDYNNDAANAEVSREKIQLFAYLAQYLEKFPECSSFWSDVALCSSAQAVDIQGLEQQSTSWMGKLQEMQEFIASGRLDADAGPFRKMMLEFLSAKDEIEQLRRRITHAKERVEFLWTWLGETIDTEPQTIFRYIHSFASSFERFYYDRKVKSQVLTGTQSPKI